MAHVRHHVFQVYYVDNGGPPATWYPDQGDFYFNSYSGDDVVLIDLKWNNAGDFSTDYPVVEIDFGIYKEDSRLSSGPANRRPRAN